ncbi:MAG: cell wall-binding repeat-containing protein, partial [Firmicutes bacterium]|nr:cell wall-binding repeat-containing protein [Bacillota bacterium]
MKKFLKKALGLTALSFLAAWALFFMGGNQALAAGEPIEIKDDEFVLEILPEIFISSKTNDVFGSSKETIGEERKLIVFGGAPEEAAEAWKNVAFKIYDKNGNLLRTDKGSFNPDGVQYKVLKGWNTKADGTGEAFTKDTIVENDMTVYAQWGEKPVDPVIPANPTVPSKSEGKVEVIGGEDRTGTASLVSSKFFDKADNVVIARRDLFPDALTASVLAKALDAPILLTHTDYLDAETAKEMKRLGAKNAYIMGLNGAISKSVEEEISKLVAKVERIGGENRYETASLIGKKV